MKITLDLPEIEGYELAEGKQPRMAKAGDYFTDLLGEKMTFKDPHSGYTVEKYIILKKKAPKYAILKGAAFEKEYVEKKVVRDLMVIVEQINSGAEFDLTGFANYLEIKELLN
jgi:hypothetical protein